MIENLKTLFLKENDILVMQVDLDIFDMDEVREMYDNIKKLIPDNKLLFIPKGFELSTISLDSLTNNDNLIKWKVD